MCLLTFMPPNVDISYEHAREAARSNPHGFGFAIHTGKTIIKDHDMDFSNLWTRWEKLREIERGAAIFHFRITTHGLTDVNNCHPFNVGDDPSSVLAHNGILPILMPVHETRSDTKYSLNMFCQIWVVLPHWITRKLSSLLKNGLRVQN